MRISVTLIVRNEEKNLARLLPQLAFADEVVVVDTGSEDETCQVALSHGARLFHFDWTDDFSAARNCAIAHAAGDYVMWLDADDVLPPKTQHLLMKWKKSPSDSDFYYMRYRMDGDFPFWFWRERIVRRTDKCRFRGFIHESIAPFGKVEYLDCEVVHRPSATHAERNLRIYQNAIASGRRLGLRDKYYYARTLVDNGLVEEAVPVFRTFVSCNRANPVDRADGLKILAGLCISRRDYSDALCYLSRCVRLLPPSGEVCCLFGQVYFEQGMWTMAADWYFMALNSRVQSGFVNEYYNVFLPNVQLSVCLYHMGRYTEAREFHNAAKRIAPSHPTVVMNDAFFRLG